MNNDYMLQVLLDNRADYVLIQAFSKCWLIVPLYSIQAIKTNHDFLETWIYKDVVALRNAEITHNICLNKDVPPFQMGIKYDNIERFVILPHSTEKAVTHAINQLILNCYNGTINATFDAIDNEYARLLEEAQK